MVVLWYNKPRDVVALRADRQVVVSTNTTLASCSSGARTSRVAHSVWAQWSPPPSCHAFLVIGAYQCKCDSGDLLSRRDLACDDGHVPVGWETASHIRSAIARHNEVSELLLRDFFMSL